MQRADVVIVCGGVAGLAAAVKLCSESNLDIILVEKKKIGANKTTPLVFSEIISEFGLEDSVHQYYMKYAMHSPLGAIATFDYQRNALASLNYQKVCTTLHERSSSNGLELRNARAVNWSPSAPETSKPLIVNLDNGDSIQTQVLIDASGTAQWAAKQLPVKLSPYYSVCYGEFLSGCSFDDASTVRFFAPNSRYGSGGGWFYPIAEEFVSMGYATLKQKCVQAGKDLIEGYFASKQEFQPYAEWVKKGVVERTEAGVIPVGNIGRFVDNRIVITGDAAGQSIPWSMMGIGTGLANGRMCAEVILSAFAKKRFDRSFLSKYERKWAKLNREPFWRSLSLIEPTWIALNDKDWDDSIKMYQNLSAEDQLRSWKHNYATLFHKVYAVAGYYRRRLAKWFRNLIRK